MLNAESSLENPQNGTKEGLEKSSHIQGFSS